MILKDVRLPQTHKIFLIGDSHEGTSLKHKQGIKKMKAAVLAEPHNYVVHMGDIIEGIMVDDKRYCPDTIDPNSPRPLIQYHKALEEFWDIRERMLVVLLGNHDWNITSKYGNFLKDVFCKELDEGGRDTYGTYSCKLHVKSTTGKLLYKIFATHGNGSVSSSADSPIRQKANKELALQRKLYPLAGDCFVMAMGHTHQLLVCEPKPELYLTDDGKDIKQAYTSIGTQTANFIPKDSRWYVNSGSFYRLYADPSMGVSGYAERALYRPNELGYAIIHVKDGVVVDVEKKPI